MKLDYLSYLYHGGDGKDYNAWDAMNARDAASRRDSTNTMDVTVAVLDTGIQPKAWDYFESQFGVDITFVDVYYSITCLCYKVRTTTSSSTSYVSDYGSHGTWTTNVVAQIAPGVKIYNIDVGASSTTVNTNKYKKALNWLYNGGSPKADIISMSFGSSSYNQDIQDVINNLDVKGVEIFASTGNTEGNSYQYPASYDGVNGVGAVYDDVDTYLTDNQRIYASGYRVMNSISDDYSNHPIWGSTYNNKMDFVAPGFDIEVSQDEGGTIKHGVVDGTSFSTPATAAVAALVWDVYSDLGFDLNSIAYAGITAYSMRMTAGGSYCDGPICTSDLQYRASFSAKYSSFVQPTWRLGYGYGVPDAFDAMRLAFTYDTTNPTAYINSPSNGATISGYRTISVIASDNLEVDKVEFYVGSSLVTTDYNYGFSINLNTNQYSNGWHTITIKAYDLNGNMVSDSISVYISNTGSSCPPICPI